MTTRALLAVGVQTFPPGACAIGRCKVGGSVDSTSTEKHTIHQDGKEIATGALRNPLIDRSDRVWNFPPRWLVSIYDRVSTFGKNPENPNYLRNKFNWNALESY